MAINDIVQTIAEARIDARSLSEFVFKPASFIVTRRLAPSVRTLQYYVDRFETIDSSFTQALNTANAAAVTATNNAVGLVDTVTNESRQTVQNAISGVAIDANLVTDALTTVVPLHSGTTSMTQLDKNRENVSIMDFFTESELAGYRSSPTTFDAARPIQAFFDYISVNACGIVNVGGSFAVSKGITFTPKTTSRTLHLVGVMTLSMTANFVGDVLMHVAAGSNLNWKGGFIGVGSWVYSTRKCKVGFLLGDSTINASYGHIDMINCLGFKHHSVRLGNLTSNTSIDYIRCAGGGCGSRDVRYGVPPITLSNRVDTGGSADQRTTLTVSELPPIDALSLIYLYVEGGEHGTEMYTITDIDRVNSTIKIFPHLDRTQTGSISARYMFGAGLFTRGGDASVIKIGKIWAAGCYAGIHQAALYGADIGTIISEENTVTMVLGGGLGDAMLAGNVSYFYTEANTFDLIKNTRFKLSFRFENSVTFNLLKTLAMGRIRNPDSTTNYYSAYASSVEGITGVSNGFEFKDQFGLRSLSQTSSLDILTLDTSPVYFSLHPYTSEYTVNITDLNTQYHLKADLGYTSRKVSLMNTTNYVGQPSITFKAPDNTKFLNTGTDTIQFKLTRPIELEFIVVSRTSIYVKFDDLEKVKTEAVNAAKIVVLKGTTDKRPTAPALGERYYDTTLLATGKPISWNGAAWVDALGEVV